MSTRQFNMFTVLLVMLVSLLMVSIAWSQGDQTVQIVEPVQGAISDKDSVLVVVRGAVESALCLWVNGEFRGWGEIQSDGVCRFKVAVVPGPNTLKVKQIDQRGHLSFDVVTIHVAGSPARINLKVNPKCLPADSVSTGQVEAEVIDAWGVRTSEGQLLTLTLDRGRIISEDLDPEKIGTQLRIHQGRAVATIVAPGISGIGVLTAKCGNVTARCKVRYITPQQILRFLGLGVAQWGKHNVRGSFRGVNLGTNFNPGYYSDGQATFFIKGTLWDRYLLTASYDNKRRVENQVFRMLTPDKVYPIYGDASSLFYEAPSSTRLFAKLERDQSYFLYGDYNTGLVATREADSLPLTGELMAYNRTLTGVKAKLASDWGQIIGFGARTDRKVVVDEIPGMGISGYYFLSARPIVDRSEKVVLQTRDRYHPEVILREEYKHRYYDYEINYQQGSLLFKAPVPSRDFENNPVLIVVSYETVGGAGKAYVGGVRSLVRPTESLTLGGLIVEEERPLKNYRLSGVSGRLHIAQKITASGEAVQSSAASGTGYAWKGEVKGDLGYGISFGGYYRYIERGFRNEFSVTTRPGTEKYRGNLVWRPVTGLRAEIEHYKLTDRVNNREQVSTSFKTRGRLGFLDGTAGVESFVKTDRIKTGSLIAYATLKARVTKRLAFFLARQHNFEGRNLEYKPTSTTLGADYNITRNVSLVVRHEMFKQSFLDSTLTIVGLESRIGNSFTAYSNYHIAGGINGRANQASIGLRNRLRLHRTLTLNMSYEQTKTATGSAFDFSSYTVGLEFLPANAWKSTFRYEYRWTKDTRRRVATMGIDGRLMQGLSFILKDTYYENNTKTRGVWKDNLENKARVGLAYRPFHHDLLQVLGKVEHVYERREVVYPSTVSYMLLGSIEGIFQPHRKWEMFGRYAIKQLKEQSLGLSVTTLTDLWMARLTYDVTQLIDVGAEYRILSQHEARDARYGWAAEVGLNVLKNLRASVGYNFEGYHDEDLAQGDYWSRGPYFKLQMKFSEHMFSDVTRVFGEE